jgi:hypothetical protein
MLDSWNLLWRFSRINYLAKQGHMPGLIYLSIVTVVSGLNDLGNRLLPFS